MLSASRIAAAVWIQSRRRIGERKETAIAIASQTSP
jgi:hypothetical protein